VAKALERMGGRIYAENILTGGLRFVIEIPMYGG
jgi:signal transduction histidine kinase